MDKKRAILTQIIMTFIMAGVMSGLMGLIMTGPSIEWLAAWPKTFIIAWPIAFALTMLAWPASMALSGAIMNRISRSNTREG
ncbi:DUF2798 domain-containing protein [Gulosibacter molinativorax]|uniref:DUF2798 domain-containing protein n=1 Tax=Gulosibacter molinativorax TaxID=256821 RepID=A0ABT7C5L3_9MICO|nr:DUF2798 domain-containing protein [Gulosibacter molinativorax]MDJ1370492.1 DUF2798 domain-containing protein [Gulosibacter molinativorax]QUY62097.1 Hypothetical protein GMOLON4_1392 [Gulosibacter molinativorax]